MIDLIRVWPPREGHRGLRRARPELALIRNNLRLRHNYHILDRYLILVMKAGHLVLRWDWSSPNVAEAACAECGLTLRVDTEADTGFEADGSPILSQHCQ